LLITNGGREIHARFGERDVKEIVTWKCYKCRWEVNIKMSLKNRVAGYELDESGFGYGQVAVPNPHAS
jgi:hypothetical protein